MIRFVQFIDAITVGVGVVVVIGKILARLHGAISPIASVRKCGVDLLNGCLVIPFMAMTIVPFSSVLFDALQKSNIMSMSLAGGVGLIFVLGEIAKLTD